MTSLSKVPLTIAPYSILKIFFIHNVKARIRTNTQVRSGQVRYGSMRRSSTSYNKGSMRQEGGEREAENNGEETHEEICGRERAGVGYMG